MVICSTRVDLHFSTVKPSILAGKTIFVEWPLESNLSLAREMSLLATKHGCKTIVGLQGSFAEPIREIKGLVDGGRIGKVLGSTMFAALGNSGRTESKNVRYFLERGVGGNTLSIHFWHALECVVSGMFLPHSFQSRILGRSLGVGIRIRIRIRIKV